MTSDPDRRQEPVACPEPRLAQILDRNGIALWCAQLSSLAGPKAAHWVADLRYQICDIARYPAIIYANPIRL
jgi:hypothetical protein